MHFLCVFPDRVWCGHAAVPSGKVEEGKGIIDLAELGRVAERGGKVWRNVLWEWTLDLLAQIEAEDAFPLDTNIEQREAQGKTKWTDNYSHAYTLTTCIPQVQLQHSCAVDARRFPTFDTF
jgi:hypothetical protein